MEIDQAILNLKKMKDDFDYASCIYGIEILFGQFINQSKKQSVLTIQKDTKKLYDLFIQLPTFEIAQQLSNLYELKSISEYVPREKFNESINNIQKQLEDIKLRLI